MKVVFAGTPEFAATALAAIQAAGHEVVLVLTQPDRPAGRGMQLHASAVKQFALQHQIPVLQPMSLKLDGKYPEQAHDAHELLKATPHDVMIVAAYGLILPESILTIPLYGCLNIHASLLPRWRGAAPIHRAIEAGDAETGITIMQMDQGLDTGAMLSMQRIPIAAADTTTALHDKLAELGGQMIVSVLQQLPTGGLTAIAQPEQGITYAAKIAKEEAALDFALPATVLERKIRAFNPFPGACGVVNGVTLKLWCAELAERPDSAKVGQLILQDHMLLVACGEGALRLFELQKPGGKRLPTAEFLKGFALDDKSCFE
ncbi:methionyl-tRNA formyltransferase [Solimicrobium silvestre]|uniref:Methionyl-tRNA formyltransferase n=1 Tax=Solimicrobium silvestre TaxID=2099400 RepID=A0A2S9H3C6_9BURK|nr:methionyl-tRNA formyltransferase [Solimicrobium silvestre]PRC94478.1 fmt: methionyl-tRNA formyltransferase [Solimicrobium silvestre]